MLKRFVTVTCLLVLPATVWGAKLNWKRVRRGIERHRAGSTIFAPVRHKTTKKCKVKWRTGGGVVVDLKQKRVLVVKNPKERKKEGTNGWTLPKGRVDKGESAKEGATRETFEETGVRSRVVGEVITYFTDDAKRHYYLLTAKDGKADLAARKRERRALKGKEKRYLDDHHEARDAKWVSFKKAKKLLQRKRDRRVLKATKGALKSLNRKGR